MNKSIMDAHLWNVGSPGATPAQREAAVDDFTYKVQGMLGEHFETPRYPVP
jgi:hypothetical protein